MTALPIDPLLPQIAAALDAAPNLVLAAPPGAGKTTRVPLALLDRPWAEGRKIVILEPRRLAARGAAARMSETLGERVGETVGYRIRLETRVSARTRIEVVTEGILVRRLIADPELADVAALVFDEFHERSLDADLGLALALEAQSALRPDLRLVAMSATLDIDPVAKLMGGAAILRSEGRAFPVETRYAPPAPGLRIGQATAAAVRTALREQSGSLLVFLPGEGEIRDCARALEDDLPGGIVLAPLYGALTQAEQDAAVRPAPPGARKVVLATAIAETSLTIEGVTVVVDAGWSRGARFDPATGMTRLETVRVSAASADQRRGRAGRTQPGVCYRLWPEPMQRALLPFAPPEILTADLAPMALDLAAWGAKASDLAWLDPPPEAALAQARALLEELDALDAQGRITAHGRKLASFAAHPRLAHMMIAGAAEGLGAEAAALAALLAERDVIKGRGDADLRTRLELMADGAQRPPEADRAALARAREQAARWRGQLGVAGGVEQTGSAGLLTALAYPDRIAQARGARGQYRLSSGRGAVLPEADPLAGEALLAVGHLDAGTGGDARIFLAAPVSRAELDAAFAAHLRTDDVIRWDPRTRMVQARRQTRLFALGLDDAPLQNPDPEAVRTALLSGLRTLGVGALPWSKAALQLRARVAFLRGAQADTPWPDWSDAALARDLDAWLGPHLAGLSRFADVERLDLAAVLRGALPYALTRQLDADAPTHLDVPSGSRVAVDYETGEPVLAVRLQEMFGLAETPRVAGGRIPVLLHLLSPAHRPVQVTRDLAGFWASSYADVKKDMKGRYPKHPWPDDPMSAAPTKRAKPRH